MAGLHPRRRTQQQIERAGDRLIKAHDAYLEAWLRAVDRFSVRKITKAEKQPTLRSGDASRRSKA